MARKKAKTKVPPITSDERFTAEDHASMMADAMTRAHPHVKRMRNKLHKKLLKAAIGARKDAGMPANRTSSMQGPSAVRAYRAN